jgi:hypothetical protein
MRYELDIHREDAMATVTVSGHVSIAGLVALVGMVVDHPAWRPGMNLLLELCGTDTSETSGSGCMPRVTVSPRNAKFGDGRLALVAGSQFEAELCRLLVDALSERTRRIVGFRTKRSALDWLGKGQSGYRRSESGKGQPESAAVPRKGNASG